MKKLLILAAFALGTTTVATAQTQKTKAIKAETTTTTTTETPAPASPTTQATPMATDATATPAAATSAKEYKTIDRNTVSPTALEKMGTKYGGYSILEAYQAADGEYKLVLSKDDKKSTAYFASTGEFIKEE